MNANVLAFSEPREALHSAVNLGVFGEVNHDGDMVVVAIAIALSTTIVVRQKAPTVVAIKHSIE